MELLTIRIMRLTSSCSTGKGQSEIIALVGDSQLAEHMCSWLNDEKDPDGMETYHHYWCEDDDD